MANPSLVLDIRRKAGGLSRLCARIALPLALLVVPACGPNKYNVALRKENQDLRKQISAVQGERSAYLAQIRGLQQRIGTVPTLPQSRLDEMFTVQSVQIGRLSGGTDLDPSKPGDEGVKVYLTPMDAAGDALKATGELTVDVFDLTSTPPARVAHGQFTASQLKEKWRGFGMLHAFVVACRWEKAPTHADLTLQVVFRDALTERLFRLAQPITVELPRETAATRPSTRPASTRPAS